MKLRLVAISRAGWGFVEVGDPLFLVKPPFRLQDMHVQTELDFYTAMESEDFTRCSEDFDHWDAVRLRLEQEIVDNATGEERAAAAGAALRLLERASPEQTRRHLDMVKARLDNIRAVLSALSVSARARKDRRMLKKITHLLDRSQL